MEERLLSFTEVMAILHIRRTTMYKIQASPKYRIPFIEIGTKKFISESAFCEWLHENEGRQILGR